MEYLQVLKPFFEGAFMASAVISVIISMFNIKIAVPIIIWGLFCGIALLIIK